MLKLLTSVIYVVYLSYWSDFKMEYNLFKSIYNIRVPYCNVVKYLHESALISTLRLESYLDHIINLPTDSENELFIMKNPGA